MPAKYKCPKCERSFVEWGAQKLNFKCPACPNTEMLKMGGAEGELVQPARLKRRPARIGKVHHDPEVSTVDMDMADAEEHFDEGGITELDFGLEPVSSPEDVEPLEGDIPIEEEAFGEGIAGAESDPELLPEVEEEPPVAETAPRKNAKKKKKS